MVNGSALIGVRGSISLSVFIVEDGGPGGGFRSPPHTRSPLPACNPIASTIPTKCATLHLMTEHSSAESHPPLSLPRVHASRGRAVIPVLRICQEIVKTVPMPRTRPDRVGS